MSLRDKARLGKFFLGFTWRRKKRLTGEVRREVLSRVSRTTV
jgi:hypothetical protein